MTIELATMDVPKDLDNWIDQVLSGEDIVFSRSGQRLVRLIPFEEPPVRRKVGSAKGLFVLGEDWDAPLPDEVIESFYK